MIRTSFEFAQGKTVSIKIQDITVLSNKILVQDWTALNAAAEIPYGTENSQYAFEYNQPANTIYRYEAKDNSSPVVYQFPITIDLVNGPARVSATASIISALAVISTQLPYPITHAEDTLLASDVEQNIFYGTSNYSEYTALFVDLSEMVSGDEVTIRIHKRIESGGSYLLADTQVYSGAQSVPVILLQGTLDMHGYRTTLQQTSGEYKNFKWLAIFRAVAEG